MNHWTKWLLAIAAPLSLASCLWSPGKFNSTLALNKNGTFVLDYKGEILLQLPDSPDGGSGAIAWDDKLARCYEDGRVETGFQAIILDPNSQAKPPATEQTTPCTAAQLAKARTDYEKAEAGRLAGRRQENEQMAKLFGLPGADDASNRAFAAKLMKYQGWRAVTYKGKGVFDVDYHFEGRTAQDFAFPLMPDSDMIIPFLTIRRRTDGAVMVTAPAFTGGAGPFSARAKMLGLPDKGNDGPKSKAEGRFTIVTDGEILTNNSEDGPQPHPAGRQVHWDVGPASPKVPEMLVRL